VSRRLFAGNEHYENNIRTRPSCSIHVKRTKCAARFSGTWWGAYDITEVQGARRSNADRDASFRTSRADRRVYSSILRRVDPFVVTLAYRGVVAEIVSVRIGKYKTVELNWKFKNSVPNDIFCIRQPRVSHAPHYNMISNRILFNKTPFYTNRRLINLW